MAGDTSRAVALAGFYSQGNFGDDLMAVLFGLHLREAGVPVRAFRLHASYADAAGIRVAHDIGELLDGAGTLVWGGGGLLVPWPAARFERAFPGVAAESAALVGEAARRGMTIALSSVGGAGADLSRLTPPYRKALVDLAAHITVRNREDVPALTGVGKPAEWFPDLVWRTSAVFPQERARRGARPRIGIDLYAANLRARRALYVAVLLQALVRVRSDCTFVFLNSRNAAVPGGGRFEHLVRGSNVERYRFGGLRQDLARIASLDVVFSSRLHVPVVALACGVPAVALFAAPKTRLLFSSVGLGGAFCGHRQVPWLARTLASRGRLDRFLDRYPHPDVAALAEASRGHLDRLTEFLKRQSAKTGIHE